jgi:hypothetical protein
MTKLEAMKAAQEKANLAYTGPIRKPLANQVVFSKSRMAGTTIMGVDYDYTHESFWERRQRLDPPVKKIAIVKPDTTSTTGVKL